MVSMSKASDQLNDIILSLAHGMTPEQVAGKRSVDIGLVNNVAKNYAAEISLEANRIGTDEAVRRVLEIVSPAPREWEKQFTPILKPKLQSGIGLGIYESSITITPECAEHLGVKSGKKVAIGADKSGKRIALWPSDTGYAFHNGRITSSRVIDQLMSMTGGQKRVLTGEIVDDGAVFTL